MQVKCGVCGNKFNKDLLRNVPLADGTMPKSKNAKKYCPSCYQEEMYRRQTIDYYYSLYGRKIVPSLVTARISSLHKQSKLTYMQIFYTTKYLLEIQNVEFSDEFILLIESACWKAMKHYSQVYRLQSAKRFDDIPTIKIDQSNKPAHKPNKSNLRITDMASV